jgi:2-polyprenyl-6-methoxyphenol hydroxylase-like FAD-dependent oxidoreductase
MGVTLLEQRSNWPGRVCGGFLNPEGVGHLRTLGVFDAVVAAGAVEVASSRLTTSRGMDRAVSVTVGGTMGLAVPRKVLEETLLDVARELGVTVRMGVRAVAARKADGGWAVVARRGPAVERHVSDLAVLADGRFSLAATLAPKRRQGWFGWNATFGDVPQRPGELSMHFFPFGYFGVLTFADGSTNVCGLTYFASNDRRTWGERWQSVLQAQPHLARLVAGATRVSDWQGVGPLPFTPAMRPSNGPVLAGDAAAVGDPYMGEGISRALGTGPILQRVLEAKTEAPLRVAPEAWHRRSPAAAPAAPLPWSAPTGDPPARPFARGHPGVSPLVGWTRGPLEHVDVGPVDPAGGARHADLAGAAARVACARRVQVHLGRLDRRR